MKKIILCVLVLFFLSGCSVNYEINITKEYISENITLKAENEKDNQILSNYLEPIPAFLNSPVSSENYEKLPGIEYYDLTKSQDENGDYLLNLKYNFKLKDYKESYIVNNSISNFYYILEDGTISISTSLFIKAFEYNNEISVLNLIINISDDYEIIDTNAQNRNGNSLTWHITYDDHKKSSINLKLKEKNNDTTSPGNGGDQNPTQKPSQTPSSNPGSNNIDEKEANSNDIVIVVGALLAFTIFLVLIIYIKNKK